MIVYIAQDTYGIHCFKDKPDLVKTGYSGEDPEWVGYPLQFGDLDCVKGKMIAEVKHMLYDFSEPIAYDIENMKIV